MNKYFFSLIILATVFTPVSAQMKLTFFKGIKANIALSDYHPINIESNPGIGATLGSYDKLEIGKHFALQGEFLFRYATSNIRDNSSGGMNKFTYRGIEAHLYAVGQFNSGSGKTFFGIGPYTGYGLDSKRYMNRWNVGAGIIFGYEFANGICINAAYQRGFPNLLNTSNKNGSITHKLRMQEFANKHDSNLPDLGLSSVFGLRRNTHGCQIVTSTAEKSCL